MVKISAQSEHFSVLVLNVSPSKFWLFKPIFRHLDPESGPRPKLNADPTGSGFGSGSETLHVGNYNVKVPAILSCFLSCVEPLITRW